MEYPHKCHSMCASKVQMLTDSNLGARAMIRARVYQAQFPQNQAKAEISVYRQFAWVNRVKYKRNQGVHLRGYTGHLIHLKLPF